MPPISRCAAPPPHFLCWLDALEHQTNACIQVHSAIGRLKARSHNLCKRIESLNNVSTNSDPPKTCQLSDLIARRARLDRCIATLTRQMKERIRQAWKKFDDRWPGVEVKERIDVDGDVLRFTCCGSTSINLSFHCCQIQRKGY